MSERDTMTFAGAHELAAIIRAYWAEHGVRVWVEEVSHVVIDGNNRSRVHCVRSDLVNGLPKEKGRSVAAAPAPDNKDRSTMLTYYNL